MSTNENLKIHKFNIRHSDDYHLWPVRYEISLKGKGYWSNLEAQNCDQDIKDKSCAMIIAALGDYSVRVCSAQIGEPLKMVDLLTNVMRLKEMAT